MSAINNVGIRLDINYVFLDGFKILRFYTITGNKVYLLIHFHFKEIGQVDKRYANRLIEIYDQVYIAFGPEVISDNRSKNSNWLDMIFSLQLRFELF